MTMRDYKTIAIALHDVAYVCFVSASSKAAFDAVVASLCDMLKKDNERFDREKFIDAIYNGKEK